ncbi:2027_t:CDS:2, partial [Ambispora gerdemannii]
VRNRLYGSLKPLQNMKNLKFYNYDNTDVGRDFKDEDISPEELGKLPENLNLVERNYYSQYLIDNQQHPTLQDY